MELSPGLPDCGPESGMKLNFPEQHAQLAQCLNALRQTGRYCDITVKVQDQSFSCHRAVLASRTPVFQCLGDDPVVRVDFLHPAAFSALLDYMYTSELTVSSGSCSDEALLTTAQALQLLPVVEWLAEYLKAKGAVDQVLELEGGAGSSSSSSTAMLPSVPDSLSNNSVSTLFPRVSQDQDPGLMVVNASYSFGPELPAAATAHGQKQPIESLFFRNMRKSNNVATETTDAGGSNTAPARWDPQLSTCHRCGMHCLSTKVLKQHQAVCAGGACARPSFVEQNVAETPGQKAVFGCSRCSQYFMSAKTLQMHMKVCSRLREYRCNLCQLKFVSQRVLDFHTRECFKSLQVFESPQSSRNKNTTGKSGRSSEVNSFSRKGEDELSGALVKDSSESSHEASGAVENIPLEISGSQEEVKVNTEDSAQVAKKGGPTTRKQFSCSQCADSFPTARKLQIHKQGCNKSSSSFQAHQSPSSDKTRGNGNGKKQPSLGAVTQEASMIQKIEGTKSSDRSTGLLSSTTSKKESEGATTSNGGSKPVNVSSRDSAENRQKSSAARQRGASSGSSSPVLTTLRSSPRHMGRTLRNSPNKPSVLSNVAKGNLRIKLMKKVHRSSKAARGRQSIGESGANTAVKSTAKANTAPKAAKEAITKGNTAKQHSTGEEIPSTSNTAQEPTLNTLNNRSKATKDTTSEEMTTSQAPGKQRTSSRMDNTATSANTMAQKRPRLVLRRVNPASARSSEGSNTVTRDLKTAIKVEPMDDSDQWGGARGMERPSGRSLGSPETSMFSAQYHCNNCGLSFPQRKDMQAHEVRCKQAFQEAYCQELSKAAKSYCCQKCMKLFSSDSSLRAHQAECGVTLYRCKLCYKDTDQPKAHLEKHWRSDAPTELRNNPCLSIERDLSLIKTLYMSVVKPNEEWQCKLCSTTRGIGDGLRKRPVISSFKDKTKLWSHHTAVHRIWWKNLTCQACTGSFKFTTKVDFLRHMFAKHVELRKAEKTFCCQICGKSFHDRSVLELHLYRHGKQPAN